MFIHVRAGGRCMLVEGAAEASSENTLWMKTQKHTHTHTKRPEATADYRAGRANCETIRCTKLRQWVCAGGARVRNRHHASLPPHDAVISLRLDEKAKPGTENTYLG